MLNDESRSPDLIDLTDEADLVVVRFNQAANSAKEIIDTYLGNYELPFASVPQRIVDISDDITLYNIHKRRNPENISESIVGIYKEAISALQNIQNGKLSLGVHSKTEETTQGIFKVNKTHADVVFKKRDLRKF